MTLTIHPSQAYALLAGLFIGKFTNLFSDVVITGLVLYIVTPEIFTEDRMERAKNYVYGWFKQQPVTIDLDKLTPEQQKIFRLTAYSRAYAHARHGTTRPSGPELKTPQTFPSNTIVR